MDLRHLSAFQQVYLARDYTVAGHDLNINRKGVLRILDRLEQAFQSRLFTYQDRNTLVPSPFADRLFNDLRFLTSAREALHERVAEIRASGRLLRIGSSAGMFRTEIFRTVFRALQTSEQVRTSYIQVKPGDSAKALAAGICDLHIGCWKGASGRFAGERIGTLAMKQLEKQGGPAPDPFRKPYLVSFDEIAPEAPPGTLSGLAPLEASRFLHWLDHPEDCPAGTRILAPDIPRDPTHWTVSPPAAEISQPVHVQFLRQHPYEFLPSLVNGLKSRMSLK